MDAAYRNWLGASVPKWDFPMPPFDPLRSFLPITNPLGFGVSDFFELGLAALLVCFALTSRRFVEPWARRFAERPAWCMLILAAAPIALRLLLLPNHPVPTPDIYDEFGHYATVLIGTHRNAMPAPWISRANTTLPKLSCRSKCDM